MYTIVYTENGHFWGQVMKRTDKDEQLYRCLTDATRPVPCTEHDLSSLGIIGVYQKVRE